MKVYQLLQPFILTMILHFRCIEGDGLRASREQRRSGSDPGPRIPQTGKINMNVQEKDRVIRKVKKQQRSDVTPDEKPKSKKAREGDANEFEVMRMQRAREMEKLQERKKREPVTEQEEKEEDQRQGQWMQLMMTDHAFFDIQIDDFHGPGQHRVERISIGCFGQLTPVTCLNFMSLTKGFRKGKDQLHYKGTGFEKIIPDFMVQMGKVRARKNSGNSVFGRVFADESFALSHNHAGWVGMANYGPDTNGSQFYVLLRSARWLDGKHVIFGKVTRGMNFLQSLGEEETFGKNYPVRNITIIDSGPIPVNSPIRLTPQQFNTDGDMETPDE